MSSSRDKLQEALCRYTTDTLIDVNTVKEFCGSFSRWQLVRETQLIMMMDINERFLGKSGMNFMEKVKRNFTARSRLAGLEEELAAVVKDTLEGLEKLDCFLDAVESLAVTSLHVFGEEKQMVKLPEGISHADVELAITAARLVCPLLLDFKRDASVFFLPRVQNAEVLNYQLDRYIQTTLKICEVLGKSVFCQNKTMETVVDLDVDLSEDDLQRMLGYIQQCDEIRNDQHFRMVFLFEKEAACNFISNFSERQPRMLQFLEDLEENAVQLDKMRKGAKISSVAGSSVGAVGGVLSIVGLALMPITAGVSLGLTIAGLSLGIGSGVNSAVTTATELGVNRKHQNKATEVFKSFMEDVQSLQDCLDAASRGTSQFDTAIGVGRVCYKLAAVGRTIDALVDSASAFKLLQNERAISSAGKLAGQEGKALYNVPRVASDIPDIGQAAVKGPLALTKSARAGFIALNALFIGMDIAVICLDSIGLAKGIETEVSQFIRARAALWRSEVDSWQKISDSLRQGLPLSMKKKAFIEMPFYPEMECYGGPEE